MIFYWSEVLNTSMFRFRILCYIVYLIRWKYSHVRLRQSCFLSSLQRLLEVITPTSNEWFTIKTKHCQSWFKVLWIVQNADHIMTSMVYIIIVFFLLQWILWPSWYLMILSRYYSLSEIIVLLQILHHQRDNWSYNSWS